MGADADTYARVYGRLLEQAEAPVILHWLGDMFDPALTGYWGSTDVDAASDAVLAIIDANPAKVDGIKISLLDQAHEEAFRARLPDGVRLYTGDDFNYADLIAGDGTAPLATRCSASSPPSPRPPARRWRRWPRATCATYHALFAPTVPLSREIFKAPTQFYKAGIAFLAWLNGAQSHFIMPGGFQSSREITHYAEVFRLADQARLLTRPDLAVERMTLLLRLHGID